MRRLHHVFLNMYLAGQTQLFDEYQFTKRDFAWEQTAEKN